ncbi:hypothetical protein DV515_00019716 [Chloebia gouldiae]|uniref:Uncharacterized protein n=1 Tax=Chloebia gouldiae TaxID=44316 RepID=A0A3L8Q405_CHLGU|nr:hypothetical protein DV515_00019716 [Chloebia gouldiae]
MTSTKMPLGLRQGKTAIKGRPSLCSLHPLISTLPPPQESGAPVTPSHVLLPALQPLLPALWPLPTGQQLQ